LYKTAPQELVIGLNAERAGSAISQPFGQIASMPCVSTLFDHKLAITIRAFNPALRHRNLQPNPRMPPRAAITGHPIAVYFSHFRRISAHLVILAIRDLPSNTAKARKGKATFIRHCFSRPPPQLLLAINIPASGPVPHGHSTKGMALLRLNFAKYR
jgi:hypothetical protein